MSSMKSRSQRRIRRKRGIRKGIFGVPSKPRLSVFRSSKHIYAQVIDDVKGATLVAVSSFEKGKRIPSANVEECKKLGLLVAERCKAKKISKIVFDKNGNIYHGRVRALADGAREGGLQF